MKLPPPEVLLSWPIPNYEHPQTRGQALIVINAIFLAIATVVVALRVYTRLFVRRWFGWDDIFICCAYVCTIGLSAAVVLGSAKYGWDRHIWDIPLTLVTPSYKLAFCAKILFLCAAFFTANSLLAFYYRLISESGVRWFRIALHCSLAFNIVSWLPFILAEILICVPVQAFWEYPEPPGARCLNEGPVTLAGGIVKTSVDLLITTLPIPLILQMNMQKRQRYGVVFLLGLGYVVTAAGAVRAYFTWKTFYDTNDLTWFQYPAFLAAAVENDVAVICACLPTLRPLLPHLLGGPISRIRNWVSAKSSGRDTTEQSSSSNSRLSKIRSKIGLPSRVTDAPDGETFDNDASSGDTKLVIQRNESFELNEISLTEKETRAESSEREDVLNYNHFGLPDPRMNFHGQNQGKNYHAF